jgi:ubiquinone/menaquinone biosynthesis C-methylase UbiE
MCYAEEQNLKIRTSVEHLEFGEKEFILDLGCGTGLLIPKIRKMGKTIVALDISRSMLNAVDVRMKHLPNVHFISADADYTPFRKGSFDVIFAITLLQNMPNPHHTLQEMKYIADSNALIIVTGLKKHFSEHSFLKLLRNARLKAELLEANDNLKCHIAVCHKYT